MNINANMKSVHSITGIPGSKKKRLPKNSGVFLLVSDSHTLGSRTPSDFVDLRFAVWKFIIYCSHFSSSSFTIFSKTSYCRTFVFTHLLMLIWYVLTIISASPVSIYFFAYFCSSLNKSGYLIDSST